MTDKVEVPGADWLSDQSVKATNEEKKKKMKALYVKYLTARKDVVEARHFDPPEDVKDYVFKGWDGKDVKLSDLFGNKDQLILIVNMGTKCPYCTMFADGFHGYRKHLQNAAAFAVMSNDPIEVQKEFATKRGWDFRMVSGVDNTFTKDLNNENPSEAYGTKVKPGVNTFFKDKETGKIQRIARDAFGTNDHYQPVYRLLDLLKGNVASKWTPKLEYPEDDQEIGKKRKRDEEDTLVGDESEPSLKKQKV